MLYDFEQTAELFDKLPKELRAALFSPETADYIKTICARHKITEKTQQLAQAVGNVILGLLSPEHLPQVLEKELAVSQEQAATIAQEINRLILYSIKDKLADFYEDIDFAPGGTVAKIAKQTKTEEAPLSDDEADTYREEVE